MSATLIAAILLDVAALALLRHRLGKLWLRRPVPLLVIASFVYQGVSPILLALPSIEQWDVYRKGVRQSYADEATLILSLAMLALTCAYLLTRPERAQAVPDGDNIHVAVKTLDWRLLILACAPLAVLTYEGRGYNDAVKTGTGTAVTTVLATTFFVTLVVLAAFSFILRRGGRNFLPVLIAQSLLLAAAGERSPVIIDALVLIVMLCHAGFRPSTAQLRAAAALTVVLILAITGLRAEQGRSLFYHDSGLRARISALGTGLEGLGTAQPGGQGPGLVAQAAVRLDSVDFAGAILQSESFGQPRLSAVAIPESLMLAVPSAVWPSKLDHASGLDPTLTEMNNFGLQKVNFLPGLAGMYFGFLPAPWLIAFLAALGLLAGRAEAWLLRRWTPARTVLLGGAVIAALNYEAGIQGMLLDLRAAAVIVLILKLIEVVRVRKSRSEARSRTDEPHSGRPRQRTRSTVRYGSAGHGVLRTIDHKEIKLADQGNQLVVAVTTRLSGHSIEKAECTKDHPARQQASSHLYGTTRATQYRP